MPSNNAAGPPRNWSAELAGRLRQREASGLYRRRVQRAGTPAASSLSGVDILNFSSNDYLGLSSEPRLIDAMDEAARIYGAGSGASELVSGHTDAHAALETALANFTGRPRALVFSTGYMANLSVIGALVPRRGAVWQDRLNHASLIDAAVLARARLRRYRHADPDALRAVLESSKDPLPLVATDGVFSMDGDIAPLAVLARTCQDAGALLMVDDAHGIGVLGENGGGSLELHGLTTSDVPVLVGTFGKALGVFGAFVAADETIIENLIQFARPYAYTTALPPPIAATVAESLRIIREQPQRRRRLLARIRYFREAAARHGIPLSRSRTAIQPLVIGDAEATVALSHRLLVHGILVPAIRPPTVPAGSARLRIALSAAHSEADIDELVSVLRASL
jgi:8-amino-7-oxononanoate synthase